MKLRQLITTLAFAVGFTTAATAGADPAIWYKFDGNYTKSGASALSFGGENASTFAGALNGQALQIVDGATHPYGGGWNFGSGAWAVTMSAVPVANANKKIVLWTTGVKGGWFGLLSDSANSKAVLAYGDGSGATEICSVAVPNITATFHLYTVRCDGAGNYELIVDDDVAGKGAAAYAGSIPSGTYQIGAVNGGMPEGLARTTGTLIDDLRIYQRALADEEIAEIKGLLIAPANEVISINIGGGRGNGDSAADHLVSAYCGLAPVVAAGWNNIPYMWTGGASKEIAAGNVKASDGVQVIDLAGVSVYVSAKNTYDGGANRYNAFHKGYLDDGDYNGHKAYVKVSGIPYAKYDVIVYAATDDSGKKFGAVKVNGTSYTWTDGATVAGDAAWGDSNEKSTTYGKNALRITGITTADVEIEGTTSGGRGGIAAVQIVETGVAYTLTMAANQSLSTAEWTPAKKRAFCENDTFTITATANATFTFDESFTVGKLSVVSEAGKMLTFKRNNDITANVGALDFSGAVDGIGWDATEGYTACDVLKSYIQSTETKIMFFGDGENGATIGYAKSGTKVFKSHIVFDGGKHSFTYGQNNERNFADNATADNPTILVKDGTTLDFYGHDLSGWSGTANTAAIIQVEDGGKLYMKQAGGEGTVYYRQRLTLDPGAEFYVDMQANNFRLQGGVSEEKAQLYVPAGSGTAFIKPANATRDSIYLAKDATRNFAAFVGAGATLDIQTKIACQEDSGNKNDFEIGKYGAGLLKLSGDISGYGPQGYDKVVKFSAYAGDIELASATEAKCRFWFDSGLNLRLTGNGTTVSGLITGDGNLVRDGAGTVTLTAANDYTGTTTVSAGTLKVAEGASIGTGNYSVAEGATLNLPSTFRPTATKLIGTSEGTVGITLTAAELETFDEGEEMTLDIPVEGDDFSCTIKVYDLQGTEYQIEEPKIEGGKIVVQKMADAKVPPFNLEVEEDEENFWEQFGWMDSNPDEAQQVSGADWSVKVGANIVVADEATATMTVGGAVPITLSTLNITNSYKLTIARDDDATITADAIDDSASTGTTTLDFATGAAAITAGANTFVKGGGMGALTIGADKTATIVDGVWTGTVARDNASTIRYAGTAGTTAVPYTTGDANTGLVIYAADFGDLGDDGLQFANTLTRKFEDGFVVTGGRFVLGNQKNHTQDIAMDGGSVTVTGDTAPTSSKSSTLFAHWDSTVNFTMNGGTFTAENAAARLGWDGRAYVTVAGGTFRTKGIASGNTSPDGRNNAASFTLSGGTLELGDYGIQGLGTAAVYTFAGGTVKAYADTSVLVKHADGLRVTGPVELDATDGDITFEGKVTFADDGAFEVIGGNVVFKPAAGVDVSNVTVTEGNAYFGFTVGVNDCGEFALPEGYTKDNVWLYDVGGNKIDATYNEETGKFEFEWDVEGKNCWWDYEFDGNVTSVGTDTTTMTEEGTKPYYNTENTALWVGHATHYRGASYPEEFTAVLQGKIVNTEGQIEMGFGSTTAGTKVSVALACGNPANDEVKLLVSEGATVKKTVLMSVPNAYTSDHLYAFVYKTVTEGETEKSKVVVYLDGIEWDSYAFTNKVTLGSGFQIGSVHGGTPTGYAKATTANQNSYLNFLRVYKTVLSQAAMTKYAEKYPYVSANGLATRTLDGALDQTWVAAPADTPWTQKIGEATYATNCPLPTTMVELLATAEATVAMNLDEAATYESLTVKDGESVTLEAGGTVKPTVSGLTTVGADLTVDYNAIGFGNVMVTEGKTLTFDFTDYPFDQCYASTTINLTGKPSGSGSFTATIPELAAGRSAVFQQNPDSGHYELVITVEEHPFVYENGNWTWNGEPVTEATVDANPGVPIRKEGTDTLRKELANRNYTVNGGLFVTTNASEKTATITVNENGTFDFNGSGDGFVTVNLNGGTLLNNGGEMGTGSRQIEGIVMTENSTVGGTGKFGMSSNSHHANVLDLGYRTLTKEGTNVFFLCNTTVTNGMIDVKGGTLEIFNSSTFVDTPLMLEAGTTLKVDANQTLTTLVTPTSTMIPAIGGEDATIDNAGAISAFTLLGGVTLKGNGTYGTITITTDSLLTACGGARNLPLAGVGTVNVVLTAAELTQKDPITVFTAEAGSSVAIGTVKDENGNAVQCTIQGGVIIKVLHSTVFFLR